MRRVLALLTVVALAPAPLGAQLPPLPDSTGWGVHVLAAARAPDGAIWVGTYGRGIYRLAPGAGRWDWIHADTVAGSLSWDFVNAFGFGPRGEVWYGTVGNGWGLSTDSGRTWHNWTFGQLGPEWQYVAPGGIATRGDTTVIATADGLQITTDDGAHWLAVGDSTGPPTRGPADTALILLGDEYLTGLQWDRGGLAVRTPHGAERLESTSDGWQRVPLEGPADFPTEQTLVVGGARLVASHCGLLPPARAAKPCYAGAGAPRARRPRSPRTSWFRRPIDLVDNSYIDQTYRYGSTMGGNFQQHQGVEFNNADGTPVHAIGSGVVVYAGRAEAGALTVAIRHDSTLRAPGGKRLRIYSVYYHNSALLVQVGERVQEGQVISRVGNTGRATNDHLHLEVHAAPVDSVGAIVDSLQRYPPWTTNPELWIKSLPGTGIVAGQVIGPDGQPVEQARIYGLRKAAPAETPFSYAETYGARAHAHPLYHENFAVGDVPAGDYVLGTEINGRKVFRRVHVEEGMVTWVVFR